ncbi:hypothetical protein N7474_000078 [Penicillium riverlandense]|uniref:uncharacterized protein n=1 Tax=Penicillium riverlandense TaxID=1903569 RepID=UPI0025493848|nr:uncharacterized protein N7474_000078 [Penicillium riverlandense]KAJ5831767.1 hypothetical protein N7474_000078 [Penicillium riverlandense]
MDTSEAQSPRPSPAVTNKPPEHTHDGEHWKYRPPYQIHDPREFGPVKWRARCECGKVSYMLKSERPLDAKYCHCRGCQVMHGAPFQWAAIFHKEDISFTNGASGLAFYSSSHNSQEYQLPTKVSCAFCHSPIMDEGRNVCLLFPELIDLTGSGDEKRRQLEGFKPTCHIFYEQRMLDLEDGLPKWSGMDKSSDLLDGRGRKLQQ